MHRRIGLPLTALALAAGLGGCAFTDGDPWGEARIDLVARFDPSERLDADGRVRTARNYLVEVEALGIVVDAATIELALGSAGASVAFDPADPPEGFSLCHAGHCHAEDGSLVDYDDIEAQLAGGDTGAETALTVQSFTTDVVLLDAGGVTVPRATCSDDCYLEPGSLLTLGLVVGEVYFEGRVFDQLQGDARRLPEEGVPVAGLVQVDVDFERPAQGEVGDDEPIGVALDVRLGVPPQIFDGLEWADRLPPGGSPTAVDLSDDRTVAQAIATELEEHGALNVEVTRN